MSRLSLVSPIQEWITSTKDLLFPPNCSVCSVAGGAVKAGICDNCLQDVAFIQSPVCTVCGREMSDSTPGDHLCGSCLQEKPAFTTARSLAYYQDPLKLLLHRLKYHGDLSVLPALNAIIALQTAIVLLGDEVIIPVPLYIKRLRHRGFNQAVLIAKLFFPDKKHLFLVESLQRIRHTMPQVGLNGIARRKNLRGAFIAHDPKEFYGRKVVLVDDVFTSGATVNECSRVLFAAGAREVCVLTLARARERT